MSWGKIHGAAAGERSKGSQPPSSSKSAYLPSAVAEKKTRHEQNRTLALPYHIMDTWLADGEGGPPRVSTQGRMGGSPDQREGGPIERHAHGRDIDFRG